MVNALNIWNWPVSYAGQEHIPFFLDIEHEICEKGDKRHANLGQGRISQCKQGMYQQERSMVSYEAGRPRSCLSRNYTNTRQWPWSASTCSNGSSPIDAMRVLSVSTDHPWASRLNPAEPMQTGIFCTTSAESVVTSTTSL